MLKFVLRAAALGSALLLLGCAGGATSFVSQSNAPDYLTWPHEQSDLKPDANVRYGILPNGMHYALMHNAEPAGTASIRLRIAAGSLQEQQNQKGLAHFLEHMAFNGSKHFAEGEAVKVLQRKGLAFGPHTNAHTGLQETVYILEVPSVDESTISTALNFMRDIADGLNLDQSAIDRERGVIMSEERQGDSPERRAFNDRWKLTYTGHQAADRLPIGDMQVVRGATRELIADFYNRYYRPERATLVMVGDFDVATMEAKVKAGFADWQNGTTPNADYGAVSHPTLRAGQHVEPNLPDDVTVNWISAPDDAPDTNAFRRIRDIREIGFAVVNRRLSRLARDNGAQAPFISAGIGRGVLPTVATVATLSVNARPGHWPTAIAAAEQELRRALQYGVQQSEVDREVSVVVAQLADAAAKANTRYDKPLADGMVEDLDQGRVFTSPIDDAAIFGRTVQGLTAETVTQSLRDTFASGPSVIFASSGQPIEGGDNVVFAAYDAAHKVAVSAPGEIKAKEFPYTNFGAPGVVASRQEIADPAVTLVRFANGVRLNIKPTPFEKDTINVKVRFAGGYLALPPNVIGMYWALPFGFIEGGLKQLTTEELEESLAGRITDANLTLDEKAFEFYGNTNRRDLNLQLQLLAAYSTDPAYRPQGLQRLQGAAENYMKQYASSPGRVLSRETSGLLRSNDPRWRFPTLAQLQAVTMQQQAAAISPALSRAPIEVTIIGDVEPQAAIDAVAATFGALPKRDAAEPHLASDVHFPAKPTKLQFVHEGRNDQAVAYAAWPGPDFASNPRLARTMVLVREMIKVRLNDEFREKQGATYSPFASSWASDSIAGFGYIAAGSETPPAHVEDFFQTIDRIVNELRSGTFDDDLIVRARKPLVESAMKDRSTNNYWSNALEAAQSQPWTLAAIRSYFDDVNGISKAEIVAAANKFLTDGRRIEVRILPKRT